MDKSLKDSLEWEAKYVAHIKALDAKSIVSFDCQYKSFVFLLEPDQRKRVSMIPSKPDATGLIHFYMKNGVMEYVTEEEYDEKKSTLPLVTFASRQPID
jgi:hypothetical protein